MYIVGVEGITSNTAIVAAATAAASGINGDIVSAAPGGLQSFTSFDWIRGVTHGKTRTLDAAGAIIEMRSTTDATGTTSARAIRIATARATARATGIATTRTSTTRTRSRHGEALNKMSFVIRIKNTGKSVCGAITLDGDRVVCR